MKKMLLIAWHEFWVHFRSKTFLFVTFLLPVLVFIMGLLSSSWYLTSNKTEQGSEVVGIVENKKYLKGLPAGYRLYESKKEAEDDFKNNKISSYLVLREDFLVSGKVVMFSDDKNVLLQYGQDQIRYQEVIRKGLLWRVEDSLVRKRLENPIQEFNISLLDKKETEVLIHDMSRLLIGFLAAFLMIFSVFTSSQFLLQSVSEEKEDRTIEIILSTVGVKDFLLGKILGLGFLSLVQILIWSLLGSSVFIFAPALLASIFSSFQFPWTILIWNAIYFITGYFFMATLMTVIGALMPNWKEARNISGFFLFLGVLPFYLLQFIFSSPNHFLVQLGSFFPLTGAVVMMFRLAISSVSFWELVLAEIILVFSSIVMLWTGVQLLEIGGFSYNSRVSLKKAYRFLVGKLKR